MQVFGANIPGTRGRYMYGTGIISVIGTSFTFLNVSAASIGNMMVSCTQLALLYIMYMVHENMLHAAQ